MSSTRFTHPLFDAVQMNRVFPDGKTFADCRPRQAEPSILEKYLQEKDQPGFDLRAFILKHYELPVPHSVNYKSNPAASVSSNIETLWSVLTREPDKENGTLISLPCSYIVPGGRFGEIYYWDSYFTMLGLKASGRSDMIENMLQNFSFLIDTLGYIPNGNRQYFLGRSQPPFYSHMVSLLAEIKGDAVLLTFLPQLEKEYRYWMMGTDEVSDTQPASGHLVRLPNGDLLNRYWDEHDSPRPESYREDVELARQSSQDPAILFRHLRAGAESGWDYSCRWFRDGLSFHSIHTTDIVPVDLNCLLYHLEHTLYKACTLSGDAGKAVVYRLAAEKRKAAILHWCWDEGSGCFTDYDFVHGRKKDVLSLAALFPLFTGIATNAQAASMEGIIRKYFLQAGGLTSTAINSGQQWDAPNGWAPLHWVTITGLEQYGFSSLAETIARRWIDLNTSVFKRTGKLMEKYNVVDTQLEAGGGEYEGQDGFGWTNGVLLALISRYGGSV